MQLRFKCSVLVMALSALAGCQSLTEEIQQREAMQYADATQVQVMHASAETTPVQSIDDAADDPAIWIHPSEPEKSLILGTDKKGGVAVYNLAGEQIQFLSHGLPNNVDLRQNVATIDGDVDLAAFSDRATNSVGILKVNENGVKYVASFPVGDEPYGFCMGQNGVAIYAIVTYKTGLVEQYQVNTQTDFSLELTASYKLPTQLEGCVYDDINRVLFIGEEGKGIWKFTSLSQDPLLIDEVGGASGIEADVEGLSIYRGSQSYLIVSSQGNDSFALYDLEAPHAFVKRFRVLAKNGIDGVQETDGLDTTAAPLGEMYPNGIIVVQDGFNVDPSNKQNFKLVPANF